MTSASSEPAGRRGSERSEATRAALLEVAGELFATRGYAQTSIRDIAREGPVSMGAIYLHFKNKAELLVEALETKIHDQLETSDDAAGRAEDHVAWLTSDAHDVAARRDLRALLVQAAAASQMDEETSARVRDAQRAHIDDWVARYEANRQRLDLDASLDLAAAVRYMWAAELGLGMLEAFGMGDVDGAAWGDLANRVARSLRLPRET